MHEQALQDDAEQREQKELQKKEKAERAAKRKNAVAEDSDVEMQDAGEEAAPSAKKTKGSKKRKKDEESDGENEKASAQMQTRTKISNNVIACQNPEDQTQIEQQNSKGSIYCQA